MTTVAVIMDLYGTGETGRREEEIPILLVWQLQKPSKAYKAKGSLVALNTGLAMSKSATVTVTPRTCN